MYEPTTGRWSTVDPKGFEAGDPDLYRFVGNDPTNFVDPTGLFEWTPDSARKAVEDQIDEWRDKKWDLAANLLKRFLEGGKGDYVLSEKEIKEIKPAVDKIARAVIARRGNDLAYAKSPNFKITQKVRWVSDGTWYGNLDKMGPSDGAPKVADEMMFSAYGGARLTIEGQVANVRRQWFTPFAIFDVKVKITIEDTYEFGDLGPLNIREKFKSYSAAHYLQDKKECKQFDDSGTYETEYKDIDSDSDVEKLASPPLMISP